jgi:hypothetical protein
MPSGSLDCGKTPFFRIFQPKYPKILLNKFGDIVNALTFALQIKKRKPKVLYICHRESE